MKQTRRLIQITVSVLGLCAIVFGAFHAPLASAQKEDDLQRDYNSETGKVTFISGEGNAPVLNTSAMGFGMSPTERTDTLVEQYAPEFGLTDPEEELRLEDESQPADNHVVTRYQQIYNDVPVMGGELIVNSSDRGAMYSMNGEVSQGLTLDTAPAFSAETAISITRQSMVKWYGGSGDDYDYNDVALWVFDESLLRPSDRPVELVWRMEVTPKDESQPIRELVLVNAETGNISLHFNQVDTAWESSNSSGADKLALAGGTWYVATTGNDSNDCATTSTPCATINGAIGKAASDDTIKVATGTYTGTGSEVVLVNKNTTLSGGWDASFASQTGKSTINGEATRRGVTVNSSITAAIGYFVIQNGLTTGYGGGILNNGILSIDNSTISGNTSEEILPGGGGGIYNNSTGTLTITNSAISNNLASGQGGGIFNAGTLTIQKSLVNSNRANEGGGILVESSNTTNIENLTIYGNQAFFGGGLYVKTGTVNVNNATISQNIASHPNYPELGHGGGVLADSVYTLTLRNTVISSNLAINKPNCDGGMNSGGHNLISNKDGCNITATTGDQFGTSVTPIAAKLGDLKNNGGPTYTQALLIGSPAIDAGDAATCAATDQRGTVRPQGSVCDIGAFEGSSSETPSAVVRTYTSINTSYTAVPANLLCDQTDPECDDITSDPHAQAAHKYAIGTYNLYSTIYNRNGIDQDNMPILSNVHYCSPLECPYPNAFWDGTQMVYGDAYGFPLADDVVAHELTHGVTQFESNLFYYYESGAINESFSDMWGEYYDQSNSQGNDADNVKWKIGEDVSGLGAIRSMSNPPAYGDPDKMTSTLYNKKIHTDGLWDNGGVHTNSGVNNKAVYLMVDGGTFNGKTVTALGWYMVTQIYYEAQTNLLSSGSGYSDLYFALQQACTNLTGQHGITAADCAEVKDALDAVQMNSQPAANFNPDALFCPTGMVTSPAMIVFEDNLESGTDDWTMDPNWTLEEGYASSSAHMLYGDDSDTSALSTLQLDPIPVLPTGAFLYFKHAFGFEFSGSNYFDGGVLEYSKDGGTTWLDAKPLFSSGQSYKGTISSYTGTTNALKGRNAFVGDSHGYVSSLYNLSSLAGQTVQFRWRLATDISAFYLGWMVDDVQVYTCTGAAAVPTLKTPANNALTADYTPLLDWNNSTASSTYDLQVATDSAFTSLVYNETGLLTSEFQVPSDLTHNTKYYWRARGVNGIGTPSNWSAVWTLRTALTSPTLQTPNDGFIALVLRPTFDWDDVAGPGVTGYTIQISKNNTFTQVVHTGNPVASIYTPNADLTKNMTLYWRVQAKGTNGPSAWSAVRTFDSANSPTTPTLSSPANNSLNTNYLPLFKWSVVTIPAGTTFLRYELQVDDDAAFGSLALNENITTAPPALPQFQTVTPLAHNTKYYWRVRAVNTDNEVGNWSAVWTLRTIVDAPTLISPISGATTPSLRPTFDWSDVTGPAGVTGYTIQISKNNTFTQVVHTGNPVASTYIPTADLTKNMTLYWRVQTKGANGPSTWSAPESFVSPVSPPPAPTLNSPANNALNTDYIPLFKWNAVIMPAGTTFDHYQIQVDDNAAFSSPDLDQNSAITQFQTVTPLAHNTKYYWRVRAFNTANEAGNWSAVWTIRAVIDPPTLLAPPDLSNAVSLRPTFDWTDAALTGVTGYTIQISKNNTFTQIINTGNPVASNYTPTVDLTKNITLYWRVQTKGANGPSAWSAPWSFTSANSPSTPTLSLPANNLLTTNDLPLFKWSTVTLPAGTTFDHYELQVDDNAAFSSPIIETIPTLTPAQFQTITPLVHNTKFYWRVRAFNTDSEAGNWSAVWTLRTIVDPPTIVAPTNGGVVVSDRTPTLDWDAPVGSAAITNYTLQVSTSPTFGTMMVNTTLTGTAYTPTVNWPVNTTFYWRIRTNGANGPSSYSPVFTFTISP